MEIEGGIRIAELLNDGKKLYVAFVGTGQSQQYPSHKIILSDTQDSQKYSEINFVHEIVSIKSITGV